MTTIDKIPFKVTIPILISIISVTYMITNKLNENNSEIKSQILELKSSQEILSLQVKNGFQTINNSRKRDSADSKNSQNEIKAQVKELQTATFRGIYRSNSVSDN